MSLPEVLLWKHLRARPDALKFRRQHPLGRYVLDFYCAQARLAVEIDGRAHDDAGRVRHDQDRDNWVSVQGIATLRLSATTVLADPAEAAASVFATAAARLPLHHPAGGPPPQQSWGGSEPC